MSAWNLKNLFSERNDAIASKLSGLRRSLDHSTTKGNATENVWRDLLQEYLPKRYQVTSGFVADSNNNFSEQIDILVFDRQYSPFIFDVSSCTIIPAESVYAAFEVKQDVSPEDIKYARKKITSVRKLYRTSNQIIDVGKKKAPRELFEILGGILTLDAEAKDMKKSLKDAFVKHSRFDRIDLGCIASRGYFRYNGNQSKIVGNYPEDYDIYEMEKPVMRFLFELIASLQALGTVPAIDIKAYARFIDG